ncbi:MAG: DUF3549 family protein [Pseudomonadota bacterium]
MTEPAHPSTLIELLEESGVRIRLYDMGRRVQKISRRQFLDFEHAIISWPAPLMRQAWFGMLMESSDDPEQIQIWFLRLPLDEQVKLVQPSRDYFLQRLLEAWRFNQRQDDADQLQDALKDNPCTFKPREERLAVFHAKVSLDLDREPSRFYAHAMEYFDGKPGWEQWRFVGYQGIADIAARFMENQERITAALPHLPPEPLTALCHCLENEQIPSGIAAPLSQLLQQQLQAERPDIPRTAALLRALSNSSAVAMRQTAFEAVLQQPALAGDIEVLAAISARAWELLKEPEYARLYLEALASDSIDQQGYDQLLEDLLFIPAVHQPLMETLRQAEKNSAIARRYAAFREKTGL